MRPRSLRSIETSQATPAKPQTSQVNNGAAAGKKYEKSQSTAAHSTEPEERAADHRRHERFRASVEEEREAEGRQRQQKRWL